MRWIILSCLLIFSSLLGANLNLTPKELTWIKNNPIVKVGADEKWPPFEYLNRKGQYKGVALEYLNIISQKTGLKFDIEASDWAIVMNKLNTGKIDILSCAIQREKRKKILNFTKPYLSVDDFVVSKKNLNITNINDLKGLVATVIKNGNVYKKLKKLFPEMKFVEVKNNLEGLKNIINSKADFLIGDAVVLQYMIESNFFTSLELKFNPNFKRKKISIAVRKQKQILFNILDKALNSISKEQSDEINKKWIFDKKILADNIKFTKEELAWIDKNRIIKVVSDPKWYPFSLNQGDGNYIGILPDILKLLGKVSGLEFKYLDTKTWSESLQFLRDKKADIADTMVQSNLRKDFIKQTSPFLSSYMVIVGRDNEIGYYPSIKDVIENSDNKKIGLMKNYTTTLKIQRDYKNLENVVFYTTQEQCLKDLSRGIIDFTVMNFPNFQYYTQKFSFSNLKVMGSSGYVNKYTIGVRKDLNTLHSILSKTLIAIPKLEIDKIYRQWVSLEFEQKIDYSLIWKILAICIVFLLIIIYWNRKLKINSKYINAIMDSQSNIVFTVKKRKIDRANKRFFEFFGYKNLEEFYKNHTYLGELFQEVDDSEYITLKMDNVFWIDKILNDKNKHKVSINRLGKNYTFDIVVSSIWGFKNLRTAVLTDVTKFEELNQLLQKAKNDALNIAKQKSEFLANMSHEIRTPMNSVIGFTEILEKEITNHIHKEYLSSIKKGGVSLLRIINDILDLSKIEAGKFEIKEEIINIKELFEEIKNIFNTKIISKNIIFELDINSNLPNYVSLDGVRLRQILFNLIGNAIKFTEEGYIKIKVFYAQKDENKIDLHIQIEDTGIGIKKENLNNIFKAFEQQANQDISKYGGTGLGLSICSKLVNIMNGKISVDSQVEKGSCFKVMLEDIKTHNSKQAYSKKEISTQYIVFEKANILIADDIKDNLNLLEAMLKNYNFSLYFANNGQEALDCLNKNIIDLVLMDLRMPVLNGYETANTIKRDTRIKHIPLIAVTASVMEKDLKKVSDFGFDDYLRKPIIRDELIEKLTLYLKYSTQMNITNIENKTQTIDINDLKSIINNLETEFKQKCTNIQDSGDFSLMEDFANELLTLIEDKNLPIIETYSKDLLDNINIFDIEKVDYLLNTFEDMVKKLRLEIDKR